MKILMLSDFYPPIIGGMERYVLLLSRELVKRGHEVTVFTVGHEYSSGFTEESGVRVIRLQGFFQKIPFLFKDINKKYPPPFQDWLITRRIKKLIETEKPDIVHANGWILYSLLPLKKKLRIRLVTTLHGYSLICPNQILMNGSRICNKPLSTKCISCGRESYGLVKSFFAYYAVKLNVKKLKLVDKFIAVSSFVKEIYTKYLSLSDEDIIVIPNFYEAKKEKSELKYIGVLPEDFILFVGALAPFKGIDVLIDAYRRINTETKLVLIGHTHPNYSYNDSENIQIIKNAQHEILMKIYPRCKFVVIPSICPDACPTVALEAMNCKKAIVASDIGGLRDIVVDGKTGMLFPSNNSNKLANAMKYLINNPKECIRMGERGYKRLVNSFSVENASKKIEKIYQNVFVK